jgi:diguanylate cyclase (GGDEF)-like protein
MGELVTSNRRFERERRARLRAEQLAARAAREAVLDPLTGLANRGFFVEQLGHALAGDGHGLAVFCIDLDRFKLVNDSLGHEAGDRLLIEVARRLRETLRAGDTIARLGEDEFTILCEDCPDAATARVIARRLNDVLSEPVRLDGRPVYTSGSIGVLLPAGASLSAEEVMRDADAAMHAAKRRGKARFELFDAGMRGRAMERLELEGDLRRALETDELVPYFQPIVDTRSGEVRGVEALARWVHPSRGLVPPGDFLPICEETGLIVPLGRRLLREACAQAQRWREWFGVDLRLSVNLSVAELDQPDLIEAVGAALRDAGAEPGTLCLEITEHALMTEASHCLQNLAALDALGVRLALDDFGTGYSSLAILRQLPISILKIDRAFMTGDALAVEDAAIIEAVIGLARALGLRAVAEGVETDAQWSELKRLGCEYAQGYFFSRPLPAAELGRLLDA